MRDCWNISSQDMPDPWQTTSKPYPSRGIFVSAMLQENMKRHLQTYIALALLLTIFLGEMALAATPAPQKPASAPPKTIPTAPKNTDPCAGLCSSQLYEEYFTCKEKRLGSNFIEQVKHFGDAAINAGSCAYQNGDLEIARSFGDMSFTDHPLVWAVLKATPGKGGSAHRMFIAELASEKLGENSKAATYKDLGLKYAKNSGQCEGSKDLQKCAEGYRDDIRRILGDPTGKGGGKLTNVEKIYARFEAFCGKNQFFSVEKLACVCRDGYKEEQKDSKSCVLKFPNDIDLESALDLEQLTDSMVPNSYKKVVLKHKKNGDIAIGVLKQPSGKVLFTLDGEEFFTDISKELSPTWWQWAKKLASDASGVPADVFDGLTHTKWRDDEDGQYKELQWQVAKEILDDYKEELKDEGTIFENFRKKTEEYTSYAEWLIAYKDLREQMEDEDIGFSDFTDDQLEAMFESLKDYGAAFPGIAIEKFVDEAKVETFSKPVIYYIGERRRGLSPQQIKEKNPEELDVFVNESVRLTFGESLMGKYEEAYQRFLLAREFGRTG